MHRDEDMHVVGKAGLALLQHRAESHAARRALCRRFATRAESGAPHWESACGTFTALNGANFMSVEPNKIIRAGILLSFFFF